MKFKKDKKYTFKDLLDIMAHLRGPNGCMWDKEQTSKSIKRNLIEEAYEAVEAIDRDDSESFKEELGDLLLHEKEVLWQKAKKILESKKGENL